MNKIIFANQTNWIQDNKDLSATDRFIHCFVPKDTSQSEVVTQFLQGLPGVSWVDRDQLFLQKRERFEKDYVRFMGKLNAENHSFIWWTMNFTSKNPLSTDLIFKVFCFFCVLDLAENLDTAADLLVVTDDIQLYRQVQIWAEDKTWEVVRDISKKQNWKDWLRWLGPIELCYDFVRLAIYHHWAKRIVNWKPVPGVEYVVITSLINQQSFKGDGRYQDTYFGELQNFFKQQETPVFLFAKFIGNWRDYRDMFQRAAQQINLIPVDYYQLYAELAKCWLTCMRYYFFPPQVRGSLVMNDCDIQYLINHAVQDSFRRNTALCNMQEYYNVQAMMRELKVSRYLYPFENRCFEKMMILGVRNKAPQVPICGFQHAAVTHKHTNFFMTKEEVRVTPLPDEIVTLGNVTRDLLIETGNFPADKIKSGCALRQNPKVSGTVRSGKAQKMQNFLVILSESVEEYIRSLLFLDRALEDGIEQITVTLRAHPTIPLDQALRSCPKIRFRYVEQKGVSLNEALQKADVVIYTSSTIGIDAISRGIPVIFLDLGDFLNPDPLFSLDALKWKISEPKELLPVVREIENLSAVKFKKAQTIAKVFADDYLVPVNEDKLRVFLGSLGSVDIWEQNLAQQN